MSATQIAKFVMGSILGSELTYRLTDRWLNGPKMPYVRAINYHDTPKQFASNFRRQLEWYLSKFVDCNQKQLLGLIADGYWRSEKPGLLISFDDGLKSNYEIAAPLLEEFGFTGWFMIPVAFLDSPGEAQERFAVNNRISHHGLHKGNLAMSWDDVRDLERRGHVVTCHSMNHRRLTKDLTDAQLHDEIIESKTQIESRLGHPVSGFTWVGGEESSYSPAAFRSIVKANYTEVFCTNCEPISAHHNPMFMDRSNVESHFSMSQVRMVLGGLYDRKYSSKRQRIFSLLTLSES
jgi:peptidoglycan/xylan/chitin deacetylase (PgdA/CDA1 family)